MSVNVTLETLLDYSDHERRKWFDWLSADPSRLQIPVQPGDEFPTAAHLLDHVLLVERCHLARLEGGTPPEATGIPHADLEALAEYAALVRGDFRRCLADLDEAEAGAEIVVELPDGDLTMTRRTLAMHVVVHEIRHLAQLALAARLAGHAPPGNHDLLYCP
jgi:uncharacterized damage-inducible protein DinB